MSILRYVFIDAKVIGTFQSLSEGEKNFSRLKKLDLALEDPRLSHLDHFRATPCTSLCPAQSHPKIRKLKRRRQDRSRSARFGRSNAEDTSE